MPFLITAPIRSDTKETTRQKNNQKISKNKKFTEKNEYLNLKAHSNNVEMQSNKTSTTPIYFLLTIQRMESFLDETMLQVNKKNDQ